MKKSITGFTAIVVLLLIISYGIMRIFIPYFTSVVEKTGSVYQQYKAAQDTATIVIKTEKMRNDIKKIDSLLHHQVLRESEVKNNITDAIYLFADSSRLKASKVEIGEKLIIENRNETAISVSGTGSYHSFGKFIESIENYPKSTRIRQVVLKKTDKKDIEGFIDFLHYHPIEFK